MLLAYLALITAAAAAPLASVFQHSNHHTPLHKRHRSTAAGLQRRAGSFPGDNVTVAEDPTLSNAVGIDISSPVPGSDYYYIVEVEIGTPPTPFNLIIDTGSADLWVPGEDCHNCTHTKLGPHLSKTFVPSAARWGLPYGKGQAAGTVCTDTITVAGFTLENHRFGVADAIDDTFNKADKAFDGMLGTGPSFVSAQHGWTVPEGIKRRGLGTGVTGYRLGRSHDDTNVGQVTFGGVDTSAFVEPIVQLPNADPASGHWGVGLDAVVVDGVDTGLGRVNVMLDTGNTLIAIPQPDADALHALIPGARGPLAGNLYLIPCDTNVTLAFVIGGVEFGIDSRDWVLDHNGTGGECVSGIMASEPDPNFPAWRVGDVFLKNVYHATSIDDNTVMLAHLAEPAGQSGKAGKAGKAGQAGNAAQAIRRSLRW